MEERLAIIAGSGQFPYLVAKQAKERGCYVLVCPVIEHANPEDFNGVADVVVPIHIGKLNKNIQIWHSYNITLLCAAGAIDKRKAFSSLPDFRMAKLLFNIFTKGDDSLLRTISNEIEKEGFVLVQPAQFVPSLYVPEGILTKEQSLSSEVEEQMNYGLPIIRAMGHFDIGQCLAVHNSMVIAVEAIEGTDAMLHRAGQLSAHCVAIKTTKPYQDMRVDLPSIGKKTIEIMAQYKYRALIVEAKKTLFFDMEQSIALANKHNITIVGISI